MGLRVLMADGTPVTMRAAVTRNLLRPADLMPGTYFVGLVTMFLNPKSQRIGDMAANTIVVVARRPEPMFTPTPHHASFHELESRVGELRGMTLDDYAALRRLCDRFYQLPTPVANKMLRDVWRPIENRIDVPIISGAHPISVMEAVVMRYGRTHGLL
jgi:hypothetical protein